MRSILAARRLRPPVRRPRPAADASLLFDEPGPRGRRRIAVISVMVSVVVLGLLAAALYELALQGQLAYPKWRYFLGQSIVRYLGTALASTLLVTVVSAALSFPLGVVLGWARLGAGRITKIGRASCRERV